MTQRRPMKEGLNAAAVQRLAANISRVSTGFPAHDFVNSATAGLGALELKDRIGQVAHALKLHLPQDYPTALRVVVAAGEQWDRGDANDPLRGFAAWPVFRFIQEHGLQSADDSLEALRQLTGLFSAEFAVRPYLNQDPNRVFAVLQTWTRDADPNVRRLASECCRPRLPWATRVPALDADPTPIFDVLARLVDDDSAYVRRSVANNLSDLCKTHPEQVINLCEGWLRAPTEGRQWIVTRATRNLVKSGHTRVWGLLGFTVNPQVSVENFRLEPNPFVLGASLQIHFDLVSRAPEPQRVVVDFAVHHQKANGKTSPKVFKLKNVDLPALGRITLHKSHPMRPISTRRYYPGVHRVQTLVNGVVTSDAEFDLTIPQGAKT